MTTLSEYQAAFQQASSQLAEAQAAIAAQAAEMAAKEAELRILREKLRLLQFRQFGKSSERIDERLQTALGLPAVAPAVPPESAAADEEIQVAAHTKKKPGRKRLPAELPREEVVVDLPEQEKSCATHGVPLKKIGEERSESVEHIPQSFKIRVTIRPKYLCPCCEEKKVATAPLSPRLIPKGIATPSLLAHLVLSKFVDHLPLYRQEAIYSREGFTLSRGTMAEWIVRLGEALIPLTNLLQDKLLAGDYLSCDETLIRVLTDNGKKVENLHYLWIRSRPAAFGRPIYLFEYASSRRTAVAREILEGFRGYLQVDQYVAYDFTEKIAAITRVGCFAHVRRKFFEAQKASIHKGSVPGKALALIGKLYRIEKEVAPLAEESRTRERKERAEPVLTELHTFLEDNRRKIPPQSPTGKAISYTLNAWAELRAVYSDHRIRLDNNLTENAIRPVAVGRKNYLFCQSAEGAAAAARIYSVIATAKANGLDLREYLIRLIDGLPRAESVEDYEALLPLAA